jgi:hypothetical protein
VFPFACCLFVCDYLYIKMKKNWEGKILHIIKM